MSIWELFFGRRRPKAREIFWALVAVLLGVIIPMVFFG